MASRRARLAELLTLDVAGGVALVVATLVALVWANLSPAGYESFWSTTLSLPGPDHALTRQDWIGEGLMSIFFFSVGLEIKREVVAGDLRDTRTAAVPVVAALGGMLVPAVVFLVVTAGSDARDGWGIPMATDIAFALAVLRIAAPRAPAGVGLMLLTLAVVDDLGAIVVIALFYSGGVEPLWLLGVAAVAVLIGIVGRRLEHPAWFVIPAVVLWVGTLRSGVHATIAGVLLGFLTPLRTRSGRPVLERLEHGLAPWIDFLVLPLFALANAGIVLSGSAVSEAWSDPVAPGILLGLVVGKLVGITIGGRLALWFGGRLPDGVDRRGLVAIGLLGGIGFTVSLFIADLSFTGATLEAAKLAILVASTVAAILAAGMLRTIRGGSATTT
jgi:NhaA family Na+:H+ antiporter